MQDQCSLGAADSKWVFPTSMFSSSSSSSLPEDSSSASFSHLINGSALTRISLARSFETYFFEAWKTDFVWTLKAFTPDCTQILPKLELWSHPQAFPQPIFVKDTSHCTNYAAMEKPDTIGCCRGLEQIWEENAWDTSSSIKSPHDSYLQIFNCYSTLHTGLYLFCPAKDDFFFQKICIVHFLQNMWYFWNKLSLMHSYHTLEAMEKVPLSFFVVVAELKLR